MPHVFSNPAGLQLLASLRQIFEKKRVYLRKDPFILFVCGGQLGEGSTSLRKKFIAWAESNLPNFNCLIAEKALKYELSDENPFRNLGAFEAVVAEVADCVLIFPESAGSFAETGFFAHSSKISRKTLVVNPLALQSEESFLNLGPLATFNHLSILQPTVLLDISGTADFTPLAQRLQQRLRRQREKLGHKKFGQFRVKHRLSIVFALLQLLRVANIENLRHAIVACFGGNPTYEQLEYLLRILLAGRFIEQHDSYYIVSANINLIEIENLEVEKIFAHVSLFYRDHSPELFEALSMVNR